MKNTLKTTVLALTSVLGVAAMTSPAFADPGLTVQQEAHAHPHIVAAIKNSENALKALQAAPDDFGGRKAQAIADLQRAIHSERAALFFRLHMDDAAIDATQF